jgi:hypothetical protein
MHEQHKRLDDWRFAFPILHRAIIEKAAIQSFFSSNSNTVLTIKMVLASSMCNAALVEFVSEFRRKLPCVDEK